MPHPCLIEFTAQACVCGASNTNSRVLIRNGNSYCYYDDIVPERQNSLDLVLEGAFYHVLKVPFCAACAPTGLPVGWQTHNREQALTTKPKSKAESSPEQQIYLAELLKGL